MTVSPPIDLDAGKQIDVLALGAAIVDILAFVDDGFLETHDVAKSRMNLIDHGKADSIHRAMADPREISGGSAGNTIAGLAALGAKTAFVGKIKDDALGATFAADMARIGAAFATAPFPAEAEGATARSMILVTPDAHRTMCTDLGVSGLLDVADVPVETIGDAKITYLEGYLWDREATKAAFRAAATAAKSAGGKIALTLSDVFCVERHRASFLDLIKSDVDILFANEQEILSLYETDDLEAAMAAARSVPVVVVTRSEKGCVAIAGPTRAEAPAAPIAELVDTTGAGDLFASGFLYGLATNRDLETCARMGCLTASEVIQHLGARPERDLKAMIADLETA